MMHNKWDLGEAVRVTRNVRNDGTYPGEEIGALLIRRGSVGNVVDVGTFLQDQIIYSVHFLAAGRIVGCREEELMGAEEPWVPSAYEFRQKVRAAKTLASKGETLVESGAIGEVLKVLRDAPAGVAYHVRFDCLPGRPLVVSEGALTPLVPQQPYHHD
jgi:nitrogen fixation protein NifZ